GASAPVAKGGPQMARSPLSPESHSGDAFRHRAVRLTSVLGMASLLGALLFAVPSQAADPGSGTVDPTHTTATWTGPVPPNGAAVTQGPDNCSDPGAFCDDYTLTVAVDPSYWDTNNGGVDVMIAWDLPAVDFDLYTYQTGSQVD